MHEKDPFWPMAGFALMISMLFKGYFKIVLLIVIAIFLTSELFDYYYKKHG